MYALSSFYKQSFRLPAPELTEKNLPDQAGRVFIVTGGYAGIGYELSRILYQRNATVWVAGRSKEKATKAISSIQEAVPDSKGKLEFLSVDFADLTSIKPAVDEFLSKETRLDVLTNNAGVMTPPKGSKSAQGFELQMGTNVLGPFLFSKLLLPVLEKTAASEPKGSVRVTWAASLAVDLSSPTGGVSWTSEGTPTVHGNQGTNYGQTKASNVLLASALHKRLSSSGVVTNAWNPGNLRSELQRHMGPEGTIVNWICHPVIYGAYTELFAGWSKEAGEPENSGKFIMPWGRFGCIRSDVEKSLEDGGDEKLWKWCDKTTAQYA